MNSINLEGLEIKEATPSIAPSIYESLQYTKKWRILLALGIGLCLIGICVLVFYLNAESKRPKEAELMKDRLSVLSGDQVITQWRSMPDEDCFGMSQQACPKDFGDIPVLLLVLGGLRIDQVSEIDALQEFVKCGVSARSMVPVYPSFNFPNLYSIATGLYPESHGIVSYRMYDENLNMNFTIGSPEAHNPAWWKGEPIWNTLGKQGGKSATYLWPGSNVKIQDMFPSFWQSEKIDLKTRIRKVVDWIQSPKEDRPKLIMVYYEEPLTTAQNHGPFSPRTMEKLSEINAGLDELMSSLQRLNLFNCLHVIVASDHGVAASSCENSVYVDELAGEEIPGRVYPGTVGRIQFFQGTSEETKARITKSLQCRDPWLRVLKKNQVPRRYHYTKGSRVGDLILDSKSGARVATESQSKCLEGEYGFDMLARSMQGVFIGQGPAFKVGYKTTSFRNVEVYNLLSHLLEIKPAPNNGTRGSLLHVLKKEYVKEGNNEDLSRSFLLESVKPRHSRATNAVLGKMKDKERNAQPECHCEQSSEEASDLTQQQPNSPKVSQSTTGAPATTTTTTPTTESSTTTSSTSTTITAAISESTTTTTTTSTLATNEPTTTTTTTTTTEFSTFTNPPSTSTTSTTAEILTTISTTEPSTTTTTTTGFSTPEDIIKAEPLVELEAFDQSLHVLLQNETIPQDIQVTEAVTISSTTSPTTSPTTSATSTSISPTSEESEARSMRLIKTEEKYAALETAAVVEEDKSTTNTTTTASLTSSTTTSQIPIIFSLTSSESTTIPLVVTSADYHSSSDAQVLKEETVEILESPVVSPASKTTTSVIQVQVSIADNTETASTNVPASSSADYHSSSDAQVIKEETVEILESPVVSPASETTATVIHVQASISDNTETTSTDIPASSSADYHSPSDAQVLKEEPVETLESPVVSPASETTTAVIHVQASISDNTETTSIDMPASSSSSTSTTASTTTTLTPSTTHVSDETFSSGSVISEINPAKEAEDIYEPESLVHHQEKSQQAEDQIQHIPPNVETQDGVPADETQEQILETPSQGQVVETAPEEQLHSDSDVLEKHSQAQLLEISPESTALEEQSKGQQLETAAVAETQGMHPDVDTYEPESEVNGEVSVTEMEPFQIPEELIAMNLLKDTSENEMSDSELQKLHTPWGFPSLSAQEVSRDTLNILMHSSHIIGLPESLNLGVYTSFTATKQRFTNLKKFRPKVPKGIFVDSQEKNKDLPIGCWESDPRLQRSSSDQCSRIFQTSLYETRNISLRQLYPEELELPDLLSKEGFLLSNLAPLTKGFEEGPRRVMLEAIESWTEQKGAVNVVHGPVFDYDFDGRRDDFTRIRDTIKPLVPSDYFYVVTVCNETTSSAQSENERVSFSSCMLTNLHVYSFVFPNNEEDNACLMTVREYLQYHLASLADVEDLTSLRLFRRMNFREHAQLRARQPLNVLPF